MRLSHGVHLIALLMPAVVLAQGPVPEPGMIDPAQLPALDGKVQQFTLTPRGDIDGFILASGTEVKTPPHLSSAIAYAIKPGDAVTIHGLKAAAIPLVQASSIIDHTTNRTIVDQGPRSRPGVGGVSGLAQVEGTIRMNLHGAEGEINGVLLADGTQLRMPPDAAATLANLLQPGKAIVAQGEQMSSPIGKVLDVRDIGSTRADLTPVGPSGPAARIAPPPPPPGRDRPVGPVPPPPPAG